MKITKKDRSQLVEDRCQVERQDYTVFVHLALTQGEALAVHHALEEYKKRSSVAADVADAYVKDKILKAVGMAD